MKNSITWHDLQDNIIDVEAVGEIAQDVSNYHIYGLRFRMVQYRMYVQHYLGAICRSAVEINFSRNRKNFHVETTLNGKVRFFANGCYFVVNMELIAEANYEFLPYDLKIQDYLYTYFSYVIEHDETLKKYGIFSLPDSLSNYYVGSEWENREVRDYHWIDIENRFPMEVEKPLTLEKIKRQHSESAIFKWMRMIKK